MVNVRIPGQRVRTQKRVMANIRPRVVRLPGNRVRDVRRGDVPVLVPVPVVQSAVLHVIMGTINQAIHAYSARGGTIVPVIPDIIARQTRTVPPAVARQLLARRCRLQILGRNHVRFQMGREQKHGRVHVIVQPVRKTRTQPAIVQVRQVVHRKHILCVM